MDHKQGLEALQNRAARIVARTHSVRSNPAMDVLRNGPRWRSADLNLFLNSLTNACKGNVPNILNNILNIITQSIRALLGKATLTF